MEEEEGFRRGNRTQVTSKGEESKQETPDHSLTQSWARSVDMASPSAAEADTASTTTSSRLWQVRRWWACKRAKKPAAGASLARRRSFSLGVACSSGQESTDWSESRRERTAQSRRRPSD